MEDTDRAVNELIETIKREAEDKVVVLRVLLRTSEGYYNYKTYLLIIYKPKYKRHEEEDVREVEVKTIYAGVYQEYPKDIIDIINESDLLEDYIIFTAPVL